MDFNGLSTDLAQFVQQEIAAGKYHSAVEVVSAALRLLQEREHRVQDLQAKIFPALERLDRGEYTEYDDEGLKQMIADVKRRGRERLAEHLRAE